MAQAAIVGVGAGVGGLFVCAVGFLVFQIHARRKEHNREIAEIERGFPNSMDAAQVHGQGTYPIPFIPNYMQCGGGWNALSSSDSVYQLPPFAHMGTRVHPAFVYPEEQPRTGWMFPGRRPRIGRLPSRARRIQALSAIIESPRGTPNAGSRGSPATGSGASAGLKHPLETTEQTQKQTQSDAAMTDLLPAIPPRASSRMSQRPDISAADNTTIKELPRPRTTRSKSLGTVNESTTKRSKSGVSGPQKTDMHNRQLNFAAPAPGPAPTGPLPPLPPLPRKISRRNHYDPSNRHSALGIPSSTQNESASTSLNSSPDRNWERIIDCGNTGSTRDPTETIGRSETPAQAGAESEVNNFNDNGVRGSRSAPLGHRRSLVRLSITSNTSTRNSCSSIASSLERHVNRLSVPQIITADRISISRVSSSGSLGSSTSGVQVIGTPRRRAGPSRVSACGSPAERPKSGALRTVSGNASTPQRPLKSPLRNSTAKPFEWDKPKHSILKGSPGARKGHRRQNCVRLSTLAPTILGPSRSNSPGPMDEIMEESPEENRGVDGPVAEKHINGDVTLRPRCQIRETGVRASLTPSSPTFSFANYHQEPVAWRNAFVVGRVSYSPQRSRLPLSREASLLSIPSLPSLSHVHDARDSGRTISTPAIAFTRPSTEWSENERTPPFGLRITPSTSCHSLYDPESSPMPAWNKTYDPSWPLVGMNPPASGQEYDPCRPISVYSSADESSSPNFPFAIKSEDAMGLENPPPVFSFEERQESGWTQDQDHNKENDAVKATASATTLPPPFKSMPILQPHPLKIGKSNTSLTDPPSSPTSSILKTPPLLCRASSETAIKTTGATHPSRFSKRRRSPQRRSNGGIEKQRTRVSGPRPSPPKDVRKSIITLRRMNSDVQVDETDIGRGSRRYLRLGRQASPELEWEFETEEDEEEDTDIGEHPPVDLLVEEVTSSPSEVEAETGVTECRYTTYSPEKPVLSLLTTLPSAVAPRSLTVWEAGEGYWDKQEQRVTEAVTASPVNTPTKVLEKMLGESVVGKAGEGTKVQGDLNRRSKAMETPKSVRSLYDPQGFLKT